MKYKVGTKVRITDNVSDHEFDIGDVVIIDQIGFDDDKDCYGAFAADGYKWFFRDNECTAATNGDKIRNMTDEELAEFLNSYDICEDCCSSYDTTAGMLGEGPYCDQKYSEHIVEWLKKLVDETA